MNNISCKIEQIDLEIFHSLRDLKQKIKSLFNVENNKIELIKNKGFDDELCFYADGNIISLYIMRGASGRIIVVETATCRD